MTNMFNLIFVHCIYHCSLSVIGILTDTNFDTFPCIVLMYCSFYVAFQH